MLPAIPETVPRVCCHAVHVSPPSPYDILLLQQSVSPLQMIHMHVTERVQPDSSSWDERARHSDCARIDVLSMGF